MESLHVVHVQAHKGADEMAASVTRNPGGSPACSLLITAIYQRLSQRGTVSQDRSLFCWLHFQNQVLLGTDSECWSTLPSFEQLKIRSFLNTFKFGGAHVAQLKKM